LANGQRVFLSRKKELLFEKKQQITFMTLELCRAAAMALHKNFQMFFGYFFSKN
jgi:hypothetical protein